MIVCCGQCVPELQNMFGVQIAAFMSGKTSVAVADLHCVCAYWLQVAETPPPGLQAFGCQDIHVAQRRIAKALRYQLSGPACAHPQDNTSWYHEGGVASTCKLVRACLLLQVSVVCCLISHMLLKQQPCVQEEHTVSCIT